MNLEIKIANAHGIAANNETYHRMRIAINFGDDYEYYNTLEPDARATIKVAIEKLTKIYTILNAQQPIYKQESLKGILKCD